MTIMTKLVASVACLSVLATAPAFARIDGDDSAQSA
jgi:hypothetical protein